MTEQAELGDLDLAALISSRICHDIISPVGAIVNGLEVLEEESDEETQKYAMDLIRKSAAQASAKLQLTRLAFGATDSAGSKIDLSLVHEMAKNTLDIDKHQLDWQADIDGLAKDYVKILLNLFVISIASLPRGGQLDVTIKEKNEAPIIEIHCKGKGACISENLQNLVSGMPVSTLDSMSIQTYYIGRIADLSGMILKAHADEDGEGIIIQAHKVVP